MRIRMSVTMIGDVTRTMEFERESIEASIKATVLSGTFAVWPTSRGDYAFMVNTSQILFIEFKEVPTP